MLAFEKFLPYTVAIIIRFMLKSRDLKVLWNVAMLLALDIVSAYVSDVDYNIITLCFQCGIIWDCYNLTIPILDFSNSSAEAGPST